jgi:hypothetical protein
MAVLLVLAAVYFRERMIFTDAAVIAFRRINLGDLESSQRRYGAYITEWVPLLLPHLHVPLKYIELAYSLSFNIFYLTVMYLLVFRWRNYRLSILMTGYYLVFASASYYWTNNEIHQAAAYLFLCMGWTIHLGNRNANPVYQTIAFTITAGLALFTHPICVLTTLFVWVFLLLDGEALPFSRKQIVLYSAILVAIIAFKLSLSTQQSYDSRKMSGILHFHLSDISTVWCGPVAKILFRACIMNYWWGLILGAAGVVAMLQQRRYLSCGWVVGCGAGFFAVLCIAFPYGNFPYALEAEWQTFGVIAIAPFAYYCLPMLSPSRGTLLMGTMLVTRLVYVIYAGHMFTERLAYIEHILTKMREKGLTKVIIKARDGVPEGALYMDWGLATESTILSAMQGEYPQRTVCSLWPDQQNRIPKTPYEMVWNFDNRPTSVLNPYYFAIDTSRLYVQMTYEELVK